VPSCLHNATTHSVMHTFVSTQKQQSTTHNRLKPGRHTDKAAEKNACSPRFSVHHNEASTPGKTNTLLNNAQLLLDLFKGNALGLDDHELNPEELQAHAECKEGEQHAGIKMRHGYREEERERCRTHPVR
jgi:hypothetical protein